MSTNGPLFDVYLKGALSVVWGLTVNKSSLFGENFLLKVDSRISSLGGIPSFWGRISSMWRRISNWDWKGGGEKNNSLGKNIKWGGGYRDCGEDYK